MPTAPKIIIAPDSFKGTASAAEASRFLAEGIQDILPDADLTLVPMADGGEGTSEAFNGTIVTLPTTNAAGRLIEASYTLDSENGTAYIDVAAASGLPEVSDSPVPASGDTYGTGVLIADAVTRGATRIVLGLGGSATTDGGSGILVALGAVLRDKAGYALDKGGASLINLDHIDTAELNIPAAAVEWVLLSDVTAPACGTTGSAQVFGPQKGASSKEIELLDASLSHLCSSLNVDGSIPGMGAAGGVAIGLSWLSTLMHGSTSHIHILPGAAVVAHSLGLEELIPSCDLLVSGEGRVDSQSFNGKVVGTLHSIAAAAKVPFAVVAGKIDGELPSEVLQIELSTDRDVSDQLRMAGQRIANYFSSVN